MMITSLSKLLVLTIHVQELVERSIRNVHAAGFEDLLQTGKLHLIVSDGRDKIPGTPSYVRCTIEQARR